MGSSLVALLVTLVLSPALASPSAAATPIDLQTHGFTLSVIRGRAVCLDSAGRPVEALFGCNETRHGLAGSDGRLYNFSATDPMAAMFSDPRVRQRDLQVTGRLYAGDQLEAIKVQSIKEGKLYDIYYFCEVCNIKAYAPGLCPCCRNDLEFRETPQ